MVLGAGGGGREEVVEGAVLEETFLPGGISPPRAEPNRPPPNPPPPARAEERWVGGCLEGEVELEEEEGEGSPGTRDSSSPHTRQEVDF